MNNRDTCYEIDLMRFLALLHRNGAWIAAGTLLCAALGWAAAFFWIDPAYSASADMLVNNTQQANTTITNADLSASVSLVSTCSAILKSHTILEQVIDGLSLELGYDALADMVEITAVSKTNIMRITVTGPSAAQAMDIAGKLVELAPKAIRSGMEGGSVRTLDHPWSTGVPVAPNIPMYTLAAGVLGLAGCVGLMLLREMGNRQFRTEAELKELLGLPVLAVIPLEDAAPGAAHTRKGGRP